MRYIFKIPRNVKCKLSQYIHRWCSLVICSYCTTTNGKLQSVTATNRQGRLLSHIPGIVN